MHEVVPVEYRKCTRKLADDVQALLDRGRSLARKMPKALRDELHFRAAEVFAASAWDHDACDHATIEHHIHRPGDPLDIGAKIAAVFDLASNPHEVFHALDMSVIERRVERLIEQLRAILNRE